MVQAAFNPVQASLTVFFHHTITRVIDYIFGDNANLWTGTMSDNPRLMKYLSDRRIGVLRGPGGSISDVFFWNRRASQRPDDIPDRLACETTPFEPRYGVRPHSWENWTMATDSFYRILKHTSVSGMITVNYGYARYGISQNPVARAAKMAADWVRYDRGRSKFQKKGNQVKLTLPPLSSNFILFENGSNFLPVNNDLTSSKTPNKPETSTIWPNPTNQEFSMKNAPQGITSLEVIDISGRQVFFHTFYNHEDPNRTFSTNLPAGVYICVLKGTHQILATRFMVY